MPFEFYRQFKWPRQYLYEHVPKILENKVYSGENIKVIKETEAKQNKKGEWYYEKIS